MAKWKKRKTETKSYTARRKRKNKLWDVVSQYVRRRDRKCITCGVTPHWQELHCGHYIHGRLDFSELNLNAQCAACNTYRAGEQGKYTLYLQRKYGYGIAETLYELAGKEDKCKDGFAGMELTEELLDRLLDYYKAKLTSQYAQE